ncbi:hypothetical protein Hanom_Chr06g00486001 [Helianthus anomalus]
MQRKVSRPCPSSILIYTFNNIAKQSEEQIKQVELNLDYFKSQRFTSFHKKN